MKYLSLVACIVCSSHLAAATTKPPKPPAYVKDRFINISQSGVWMAHDNGYTGGLDPAYDGEDRNLQTVIAVLDSGADLRIDDLSAEGKILAWKDFSPTQYETAVDYYGHGTKVASIAAGDINFGSNYRRGDDVYGIAPGAQLIIGKIFDDHGSTEDYELAAGLRWTIEQQQILKLQNKQLVAVNLSLGTLDSTFMTPELTSALISNLDNGISLIIASGNESLKCLPNKKTGSIDQECSFPAVAPWIDVANQDAYLKNDGAFVVVGAVDKKGKISSFSNKAGITKSNFIVAPGEQVASGKPLIYTEKTDSTTFTSGTSMATPVVSGAMALMEQRWPQLTGNQQAGILFSTAKDLGKKGIDDVYGNGLIDLVKAFNPIGTFVIPQAGTASATSIKVSFNVAGTTLALPAGAASAKSFAPLDGAIGIDGYGRDFAVNLSSSVSSDLDAPIDFNNFMNFSVNGYIIGVDQVNQLISLGYKIDDNQMVSFSYDDKSALGIKGTGAFATNNEKSYYTHYRNKFDFDNGFSLGGDATYGYGELDAGGIITEASSIQAFGANGYISYNNFGFNYGIPMQIVKGSMSFAAPTTMSNNGDFNYFAYSTKLNADSVNQKASFFYQKRSKNLDFRAELNHYVSPYNVAGLAEDELKIQLKYIF